MRTKPRNLLNTEGKSNIVLHDCGIELSLVKPAMSFARLKSILEELFIRYKLLRSQQHAFG